MKEVNHKRGPRFKDEKTKKRNYVAVRLEDETYWDLTDASMKAGIPVSTYVRVAIEEALARDKERRKLGYEGY